MDKPENSTLLNVCVLPDERVSAECVRISQSFESENTMFVLGSGLFPHMTVYMARFANDDIEKVVTATEDAFKQVSVRSVERVVAVPESPHRPAGELRRSAELV